MIFIQQIINLVILILCIILIRIAWVEEMQYFFTKKDIDNYITKEGLITFISGILFGLVELLLLINYFINL